MSTFKKASKKQSKLRAAFFGPSGAGKTFTALRVATGLGGSIAVIDTERGSASKYSDRFSFDVCELQDKSIDGYASMIREAIAYDVLIIDSLSHGWQELLEQVEKLAQAKYRGNTWSAWSEGTPMQRALVDAILSFPGHIIATMRSKTEWTTETNERGKSAPKRVGLAPEQGKGIEYEFDLLMELTVEHFGSVIKDRSGKFQDKIIDKPGEDFGKQLAEWLSDGVAVVAPPPVAKPAELPPEQERAKRLAGRTKAALADKPADMPDANWLALYAIEGGKLCDFIGGDKSLEEMSIAELKDLSARHAEIIAKMKETAK